MYYDELDEYYKDSGLFAEGETFSSKIVPVFKVGEV